MRVAVVTDSTADLPSSVTASPRLFVADLSLAFGDDVLVAGVDIDTDAFYARLATSEVLPVTSQPGPQAFDDLYRRCAEEGFDHVVSVHCSSELSGTYGVATSCVPRSPIPVDVVDSRLVGGALGLAVERALKVADRSNDPAAVVSAVEDVRDGVVALLVVDTLEFLHRGGRLSAAQATVGTALKVKPVLRVVDGRIEVVDKARTSRRALARAVEIVAGETGGGPVDACVAHAADPVRADTLEDLLAARIELAGSWRTWIGPIVGTHVGPGAVGVAAVSAA